MCRHSDFQSRTDNVATFGLLCDEPAWLREQCPVWRTQEADDSPEMKSFAVGWMRESTGPSDQVGRKNGRMPWGQLPFHPMRKDLY